MPELDVQTIRSGRRIIRLSAADAISARLTAQSECGTGQSHCPPDWCTDDIQSLVVQVHVIAAGE